MKDNKRLRKPGSADVDFVHNIKHIRQPLITTDFWKLSQRAALQVNWGRRTVPNGNWCILADMCKVCRKSIKKLTLKKRI